MPTSFKPIDRINLILVPYHVGILDHRVGAGPKRILNNKLVSRLKALNKTVTTTTIDTVEKFEGEIGRSFEIIRRVSTAVSTAVEAGAFPIVLAGNCNASVGVAAGLNQAQSSSTSELEVVWFDAHPDMDNPDDMLSGYFDGSGVSMLMGESWKALMRTVPGHQRIGLDKVTYCGVRDLNDSQSERLSRRSKRVVYGNRAGDTSRVKFAARLSDLLDEDPTADAKTPCLVHVDLDCLDVSLGQINEYAAPGGLDENDLLQCLDVVNAKRRPISLTVASFNPHLGGADKIADIAVNAIIEFVSKI